MKTNVSRPEKEPPVPTGRSYTSVAELLVGEGASPELMTAFAAVEAKVGEHRNR